MNAYNLTDEVKEKWTPIIRIFLDTIDNWKPEYDNDDQINNSLDLSGTELNPYTLREMLTNVFGYEEDEDKFTTNGWDYDFWFYFHKNGHKPLVMSGTGVIFSLYLSEEE